MHIIDNVDVPRRCTNSKEYLTRAIRASQVFIIIVFISLLF